MIYSGRRQAAGLLGDPDLLRRGRGRLRSWRHQVRVGRGGPGGPCEAQEALRRAACLVHGHSGAQGPVRRPARLRLGHQWRGSCLRLRGTSGQAESEDPVAGLSGVSRRSEIHRRAGWPDPCRIQQVSASSATGIQRLYVMPGRCGRPVANPPIRPLQSRYPDEPAADHPVVGRVGTRRICNWQKDCLPGDRPRIPGEVSRPRAAHRGW